MMFNDASSRDASFFATRLFSRHVFSHDMYFLATCLFSRRVFFRDVSFLTTCFFSRHVFSHDMYFLTTRFFSRHIFSHDTSFLTTRNMTQNVMHNMTHLVAKCNVTCCARSGWQLTWQLFNCEVISILWLNKAFSGVMGHSISYFYNINCFIHTSANRNSTWSQAAQAWCDASCDVTRIMWNVKY
jgi:hypothetical protein